MATPGIHTASSTRLHPAPCESPPSARGATPIDDATRGQLLTRKWCLFRGESRAKARPLSVRRGTGLHFRGLMPLAYPLSTTWPSESTRRGIIFASRPSPRVECSISGGPQACLDVVLADRTDHMLRSPAACGAGSSLPVSCEPARPHLLVQPVASQPLRAVPRCAHAHGATSPG